MLAELPHQGLHTFTAIPTKITSPSTTRTTLAMNSSTTSFSSTTHLIPSQSQKKDYQSAFASLQSQYGASGMSPVQPKSGPKISTKTKAPQALQKAASSSSHTSPSHTSGSRNWENALANLQTSYGFGGSAPSHRTFGSSSSKSRDH